TGIRERGLVGIAEVVHPMIEGIRNMEIRGLHRFPQTISYQWFRKLPEYRQTQAARLRHRGTMFSLTGPFIRRVRERLKEMGDLEGRSCWKGRRMKDDGASRCGKKTAASPFFH